MKAKVSCILYPVSKKTGQLMSDLLDKITIFVGKIVQYKNYGHSRQPEKIQK